MNLELAAWVAAAAAGVVAAGAWHWRRTHRAVSVAAPGVQADIDPVTGLMTRSRFEQVLHERLTSVDQPTAASCVLHVGIDALRLVHDDGGPELADQALKAVASRLRAWAGASAPLARVSADEFVIWLDVPEKGEPLAHCIAQAFAAPLAVDGRDLDLSVSVGLALVPDHGTGPRVMLKAAAAMRAVQRAGGGAHAVFDPQIEGEHNAELAIARELRDAVAKGQLELFFQPKIDAQRLEVTAVEALMRWRHPTLGLIGPTRFIPIAERHGLIVPLGQWALERALKRAAAWRSSGLPLRVAVNLSGAQFRQDDFAAGLERTLKAHGLPAGMLSCEIAEGVALEATAATRRAFERLHKLGVQIAVGEFSGQTAGLAALADLPLHEVKVSRTLVAALPADDSARRSVEQIVAAAHARGLRVVAEGIETEAQRNWAMRLHCDELQGFMLARPMSARAVGLWASDASKHLAQTFGRSQFQATQLAETRMMPVAHRGFAQTLVSTRR